MHADDPQASSGSRRRRGGFLRPGVFALVAVLVLGGALLGGVRVLLPEIRHLRPEIEGWVSKIFEREVRLGAIEAYWRGWIPVLRIGDVRLVEGETADGDDAESSLRLSEVSFSIDPVKSLRLLSVQPFDIAARGASFLVERNDDGSFSFQGFGKRSDSEPREHSRFVLWALAQSRLSLFDSQAVWIDQRSPLHEVVLDIEKLHLLRAEDGYRFSGSFGMPDDGRVEFTVDVNGDPLSRSWTGSAYARLQDLELDNTGLDARPLGGERFTGRVTGEVWSTWTPDGVIEAEGTVRAELPGVMQRDVRRGVDKLEASFRVGQVSGGWELSMRDLVVVTPRGQWPKTGARVQWAPSRDSVDGIVVVNTDYARIEDLIAVVAPHSSAGSSSGLSSLIKAAPRGALEELHVSVPITDRIDLGRTRARGRFMNLGLGSNEDSVSLEAANGRFEAGSQGIVADVEAGTVQVNLPRWFSQPLRGEILEGALTALPSPEGLRIRFEGVKTTTSAGAISAHGWVLAPRDRSGLQLDFNLDVGPSSVTATRTLLSERALPNSISRWLENAASDGRIRGARLHIQRLPSGGQSSGGGHSVSVTADLAFPSFRYARGWPELSGVSGRLMWRNGGRLEARIDSGQILDSNIRGGSIIVGDLQGEAPQVEVRGSIDGPSADLLHFVRQSPLRRRFAAVFDGWTVHGSSTAEFDLDLQFRPGRISASVGGDITVSKNRVHIPFLRREFENVSGVIRFGIHGIQSDGITASWHGEPLGATIGPSPEPNSAARLSIQSRMTTRLLGEFLHDTGIVESQRPEDSPLLGRLDGDAALNLSLDLPSADHSERDWLIGATTDLDGIAVDLPLPLGKSHESAREFTIRSAIASGSGTTVHIRYGDSASAVLGFVRDAGRLRLERGTVRLDAQPATLPDTEGLTVHGTLPSLDSRVWLDLVRDLSEGTASDSASAPFGIVREWSISAESATAAGALFPKTHLQARLDADGGWQLHISGDNLEGTVRIPPDILDEPISANLDRLVFVPDPDAAHSGRKSLDPRTLPGLSLSAGQVVLGDYDLGAIRLTTARTEVGLSVERLEVETDGFRGGGTGLWSLGDAGHRTEFDLRIHGDDLGRMLDSLGFDASTVSGGITNVSIDGAWQGTPADFAPEILRGVIQLHSTDGRLTHIERGVPGRVFGLITFTSLPRRLVLDFGDLFSSGIEFDLIEGSFALKDGNAYTDDLVMESDTARIEVVGRTGLLSRDYDKLVTVIPKVSSSLPLVPIWVLQKLLDRNVFDKAFAYQYTISGPWDDPDIELVRTERIPETREE